MTTLSVVALLAVVSALAGLVWLSRASRGGEVASLERERDEAQERAAAEMIEAEYDRKIGEEERRVEENVAHVDRDGIDPARLGELLSGSDPDARHPPAAT